MAELDPSVADYLKDHRTAVLATNRKAGAPQQTLIAYHFDGTNIAISVTLLVRLCASPEARAFSITRALYLSMKSGMNMK